MATKKQLEPVAPAADKKKALAAALGQIEKQFGKGSVMRLGENTGMNIEHIPTGSIGLDLALGIGGLPRGRIIEIYGPESSGKTTVALHSVAEAQKLSKPRRAVRSKCPHRASSSVLPLMCRSRPVSRRSTP